MTERDDAARLPLPWGVRTEVERAIDELAEWWRPEPRRPHTALGSGVVPLPAWTLVVTGEAWQASGEWLDRYARETFGVERVERCGVASERRLEASAPWWAPAGSLDSLGRSVPLRVQT